MHVPAKAPDERTCQLVAMKHESTVYQFHNIYRMSVGHRSTGAVARYTEILQASEPIPPMSIPPMSIPLIAAPPVALARLAAAVVVTELVSISIVLKSSRLDLQWRRADDAGMSGPD